MEETVFANEFVRITREGKVYSLYALSAGLDMQGFQKLMDEHLPQVLVTGLLSVQKALEEAKAEPAPLGI